MALNIGVNEDQAAPTTRTTRPGGAGVGAAATVGIPGFNQYGNQPLNGRLPARGLSHLDLSALDILQLDPLVTLELLPLIFPDAALAVHNILRLGNPGWEVKCYHAVTGKLDKKASRLCADMLEKANRGVDCEITGAMGGPDSLINSLLWNAYVKGACCTETVLDETLTVLEDIVPVDPFTIHFEERPDKRGRYRIYQIQAGTPPGAGAENKPVVTMPSQEQGNGRIAAGLAETHVELNPNLLTYVPLDETLYGRSMIASALQPLILWTRYYIALQVFLHNVAFGDKDGEIDTNLLLTILDKNITGPEREKWKRNFWPELIKLITIFADDYKKNAKRDPNSALIHSDLLKMSSLGTARGAYPVEEVMKVCKREIYAALKMLPIMMGANDTVTETHATVQMQIFTSGLNYIQGAVKHSVERPLLTGLRAMAYNKNVRVELAFASLSLEERGKLATAIAKELENEAFKRDEGWITQDEASENATGSPAIMDGPNGEPADNPLFVRADLVPTVPVTEPGAPEGLPADGKGETGIPAPAGQGKASRRRDRHNAGRLQLSLDFPASNGVALAPLVYATNRPERDRAERETAAPRYGSGFAGRARASSARYGRNPAGR